MQKKTLSALVATAALAAVTGALAQSVKLSDNVVKVGVLTDLSGVYSELSGQGSVKAAQMAADDFMAANPAFRGKVQVIGVDHQNKADVASNKAAEMIDRQNVDMLVDMPTSSAALAASEVAKNKKVVAMVVTGGTTALTNEKCNKYTFHYAYDNYMLANGTGSAVTKRGGKTWYIIYPNYAFGQDLNRQMTAAIQENGGKLVAPSDATPFPNTDFSSYLLKAQGLKPKIFGTMQAGADLVNVVKQYNEFGLKNQGIGLGIGLLFETDVAALGQDAFAGAIATVPWFWNLDARSRVWAAKFEKAFGKKPTWAQAGVYSATMTYLQAVARAKTDDSDAVVKALEGYSFDDFFARNATIRPQDHRVILDVHTVQVKPKAQAKEAGDIFTRVSTIPAAKAFMPLSESKCKM
ncbi:ABC transporter substrate-binding protein [Deinococcus metallilatus]|uniref:ABC transporter substrate-binding protein n=1 Tax=Deinococcus metallilatus TaxID=1211322 RepID=A0AAJ5F1E8_9DEIO|nr:ABC transporter substrate-binding protein [Deinococcus metallilatus]MBB5296231.1 branched-chain amino acid transport system substrate-binding protein [Deinococcus metallilatus]QBY09722.1 ABC transporter substrate-binding protein [Deinococcus metallilatus]RXJ08920.1 ABC transporter substrate-binding protein [Deinococcus metallilatus]TLK23701.1 ABC transporter substrate-binding protein [Deinococcus metallilatus]GMA14097.1 ABC transporter permease [Deinococcus metallilatus]